MPELGSLGSVRGAFSNERPYREHIETPGQSLTDQQGFGRRDPPGADLLL